MRAKDCPYCREEIKVSATKCRRWRSYVCKLHGLINVVIPVVIPAAVPLALLVSASMIVIALSSVKEGIRKGSLMRLLVWG